MLDLQLLGDTLEVVLGEVASHMVVLVLARSRDDHPVVLWQLDSMPRVLHEGGVLLVPDLQAIVLTSGEAPVHHELTVP